jgi:hypothetical protein
MRAPGLGSSTSPAMVVSKVPCQVGTNRIWSSRVASVRRAMSIVEADDREQHVVTYAGQPFGLLSNAEIKRQKPFERCF